MNETIRRKAEALLQEEYLLEDLIADEDLPAIIHEFRVHQLELQVQNEELRRVQHELALARNRYANLYDLAPIGYFTIGEDGLILEINSRGATMLGMKREQLLKQSFSNFVVAEDQGSYFQYRRKLFKDQAPQDCEIRLYKPDQSRFYARLEGAIDLNGEDGLPRAYLAVSDVTTHKQAETELQRYRSHLEELVKERTAELQKEVAERKQVETALAEERNLLRALVDHLPDYIFVKDTQSRFLLANEATRRHLGAATVEEMVGKTDFDYSPPELAAHYYADEQKIFATGEPLILYKEPIFDHETESRKWVSTIKVPFYDSNGQVIGLVGMNRDITKLKQTEEALRNAHDDLEMRVLQRTADLVKANDELQAEINDRKQAEEALRESEQRYKQLLKSVTDYIYTVSIEPSGMIRTTHSPNCEAVTGYTSGEYETDPGLWYRMIYEPDRHSVVQQSNQLLGGNPVEPLEHRIIHKNGSVRWVRNTPVLRKDEHQQVTAYDGLISDITARKEAEEALRQSERRYRLLMEYASDGIIIQDGAGNLLKVNSKTCEMLGYAREELLQKNIGQLIAAHDLAVTPLGLDELRSGQALLRERQLVRREGTILPVEISAKMIEPDRVLAILRDITERKKVERREKLAYQLGRQLTSLLNPEALLQETVNRLKEVLGYYHVHVFLVEEPRYRRSRQEQLVMCEGTGEAGALMKQQHHTIPLHTKHSLVAQAARSFEPVVVNDVSQHPDHLPNPLLPKTRSEVAIPLFRGQHPIGVLDVQHTKTNHFDVNEIRTLQIVASQLSVTLTNAQLFAENARRLAIIDHSSDLVALVDLDDGSIIDINPAGIRLAGYDQPDALLYKPLAEILPYENLKQAEEEGIPTALEQGAWRGESLIYSVDGTIIPVAQTMFVIHSDEGQPHMLAVIMTDITKRKQAEEERERLFEEVKAGRERLQVLSHRLVEVQEAERRHIARELHDEVGQLLTGLKLTLEMSSSLSAEATKTSLREAQTLVNELIGQVRELSLELRPAMLDDLGLLPTLQWLFERYTTQTQIQVAFKHTGLNQRFMPAAETAAYRIMQEALTNVARYAGVDSVQVEVWTTETTLNVQIEDQGVGFDPEAMQVAANTSGLSGMSERAALLGGTLTIESVPQGGTRLRAELPLRTPVENGT